jgi:hypothetical protein
MSKMYRSKEIDMTAIDILHDVLTREYGTSPTVLSGVCKRKRIIMAEAMASALLRDTFKLSFVQIGKLLGRHHSTAGKLYRSHSRYYALNYQGYRWDFHDVATEFKGKYYNETNRNTQENTR